jgi:hypothetical protein
VQGTLVVDMELADVERLIHNAMRSTYVTARAAGRHMIRQGSGVMLMFGGRVDAIREYKSHPRPDLGAFVDHERGGSRDGCWR